MTEPVIKLPSMIVAELLNEERDKMQAEMQAEIEKQKIQLASKDTEIQHLQELVRKLSDK